MKILASVPITQNCNQNIFITTHQSSKLTQPVPKKYNISTSIVPIFFIIPSNHIEWHICSSSHMNHVYFRNSSKIFAASSNHILKSRAYDMKSNCKVKNYNKTIIFSLLHYNADHKRSWDFHKKPLISLYNTHIHYFTGTKHLIKNFTHHLQSKTIWWPTDSLDWLVHDKTLSSNETWPPVPNYTTVASCRQRDKFSSEAWKRYEAK